MTEVPAPKEGEVLAGRYSVERVIAQGGMGVVVAAKHIQLGQRVAIKILHHDSGNAEQSVARFLTEAKASALLKSEHVVKVSDVGTLDGGAPFMVMELLEGADLATVLDQEGPLPVPMAVDFLLQAMEGLAAAHAAHIVHRDLKPGNIFRCSRDDGSTVIKVLDFGVSKATSSDVRAVGTVTTTDAVFGSPLYMSPEQMQSATRVDERSDIWSLGVVLYELCTGRLPFEAESMAGLAVVIATEPPTPMGRYLGNPPPGLDAVVEKCLAKRPPGRYANVAELAADLEPFCADARSRVERIQRLVLGKSAPARVVPTATSSRKVPLGAETLGPVDAGPTTPPAPRRSRAWMPIAAALVVVLAGVGFMLSRPSTRTPANALVPSSLVVAAASAPTAAVSLEPPPVAMTATPMVDTSAIASAAAPPASGLRPAAKPGTKPTSRPLVSATISTAPPSAAATGTVLSGIARDRK